METKKLKPFDLEKAKQGAKVVTRDGRPVRIICWDRKGKHYPIVALVEEANVEEEVIETYTLDGVCVIEQMHDLDLFMTPTVVERWVNLHRGFGGLYNYRFYESEQGAFKHKDDYGDYVATAKITWEE
jgi:hypothetical protein